MKTQNIVYYDAIHYYRIDSQQHQPELEITESAAAQFDYVGFCNFSDDLNIIEAECLRTIEDTLQRAKTFIRAHPC